MKRKTPYQGLLDAVRDYVRKVRHPYSPEMWTYSKEEMKNAWSLKEVYERTAAANQLGFDVVLVADNGSLRVKYRKRPGDIDWFIG